MESRIISIMAKGLESLRKIAQVVQQSRLMPKSIYESMVAEDLGARKAGKSKATVNGTSRASSSRRLYRGSFRGLTRGRWQKVEQAFADSEDNGCSLSLTRAYEVIFTEAEKSAYLHEDFLHDLRVFRRGCTDVPHSSSMYLSEIRPFLDAMR